MQFEAIKTILLSDTLVPDIFLGDIMPHLPSDAVKVYFYCLFLSKHKKETKAEDLAARLDMSPDTVNAVFVILEREGLVVRSGKALTLVDVKERELNRLYHRKTTSEPEEALTRASVNIKRNQCIDAINKTFFQGIMAPSWYTTIDHWFEIYQFEEDVMFSLFRFCYDNNALNVKYIEKVGATWNQKGIKSHWELEKYMEASEQTREIGNAISRALRLGRKLTSYEEKYLETWLNEFGYSMDVIEEALERTAGKANPNFKYIHSILAAWNKEGIRTRSQLSAYLEASSSRGGKEREKVGVQSVSNRSNFTQRNYDDSFFDKLSRTSLQGKDD